MNIKALNILFLALKMFSSLKNKQGLLLFNKEIDKKNELNKIFVSDIYLYFTGCSLFFINDEKPVYL